MAFEFSNWTDGLSAELSVKSALAAPQGNEFAAAQSIKIGLRLPYKRPTPYPELNQNFNGMTKKESGDGELCG